jgi:putative transposase
VKINGERQCLWLAVDHEGEVLESYVTERRNRSAALFFPRNAMKRCGPPEVIVTGKLKSYSAAMRVIGNVSKQETGRGLKNLTENSRLPFRRRECAMIRFRLAKTL